MINISSFDVNSQKCNNKTVVLVALHASDFSFIGESQGICAISGFIKSKFKHIDVKLFDQQLYELSEIVESIKEINPILLGISVKLKTFDQLIIFYNLLRKKISKQSMPLIILGNSIPHFNGGTILLKYFSDVIIGLGEGEIVFKDLCRFIDGKLNFKSIRNIMYLENGIVVSRRQDYLDQNCFTRPDRTNTERFFTMGGEVYIEGSRGCAYGKCTICQCQDFLGSRTLNKKWRSFPLKIIVDDIKGLVKNKVDFVTFAGEDFFGYNQSGISRAAKLSEELIKNKINISFRINARVKSIYDNNDSCKMRRSRVDVLRKLKSAGLVKIFLGFESGSLTQLKRYNKGFQLVEFEKSIEVLNEIQINYELGYIPFDPLMTFSELKENITFLENNQFLIHRLSSVYKELRIQIKDGIYVKLVRNIEIRENIKILGNFDFNKQEYIVDSYLDMKVMRVRLVMKKYTELSYRVCYLIRILTQYSLESVHNNFSHARIFFQIGDDLKRLEYKLLYKLVIAEESRHLSSINTEILKTYEVKKRMIFEEFLNNKNMTDYFSKHSYLEREVTDYIEFSKNVVNSTESLYL